MSLVEKYKSLDKYEKTAILVIVIAILLRISLAAVYHVSGDACWQLSNAKFISENNEIPLFEQFGRGEPFWPPPLFHIISAFVYGLFSNFSLAAASFMIKMVSPIFGSLTLILFYLIAKQLFSNKVALMSILFLSFIPLHLDYSIFSYVDGTVTFLAVLCVYFALKDKFLLASIIAGLAILTKYNGIFIIPVIWYIAYIRGKGEKAFLKKFLLISTVSITIGGLWFLRNWILLGNPVYPFLNSMFGGLEIGTFADSNVGKLNFMNLLNLSGLLSIYLGFFGIPDGNIKSLAFIDIPYLSYMFAIWFIGTVVFIFPVFLGLLSKNLKHKKLLYIWLGSYLTLILFYIINASWSVSRFLLPAFPVLALAWATGLDGIKKMNIRKYFILICILIIIGFTFTSIIKISFASGAWEAFNQDFDWAQKNSENTAIFMTGSQCLSYNLDRQTVHPSEEGIEKADYVFMNQDFSLDRLVVLDDNLVELIENKGTLVYENVKSKTKIYKMR
jgi:4-amino-4-deoxy-L-arabinose transferase-like glycosyltransferase